MKPATSRALSATIRAVELGLRKLGRPHMIVGGIAIIARGVPRLTRDVDATVWAPGLDLRDLVNALGQHRIAGRVPDFIQLAKENQVVFLEHTPTKTPLEILLAWLPFELVAMQRAETLKLGSVNAPVALAEDLVIYKVAAWQDRDRDDVERLLVLHAAHMDLSRIRELVRQFAEALDAPERIVEFEQVLGRALGTTR